MVIAQREQELDQIRQKMLLIRQKKIMMEKLQEKDFANFKKEFEHMENKTIDEIATVRFTREKS